MHPQVGLSPNPYFTASLDGKCTVTHTNDEVQTQGKFIFSHPKDIKKQMPKLMTVTSNLITKTVWKKVI